MAGGGSQGLEANDGDNGGVDRGHERVEIVVVPILVVECQGNDTIGDEHQGNSHRDEFC